MLCTQMRLSRLELLHIALLPRPMCLQCIQDILCVRLQAGNAEDVAKYAKRTVQVTQQHNDECKRLLELMGVPIINVSFP